MSISVQAQDFDMAAEIARIRESRHDEGQYDVGAICSFIGTVRHGPLTLEHYPGMTERALQDIHDQALNRFGLIRARLIHRFGPLQPGDQIVGVIALSRHRQAAFDATNFMMDRLKTDAPFWKLEEDKWVDQRSSDIEAAKAWHKTSDHED